MSVFIDIEAAYDNIMPIILANDLINLNNHSKITIYSLILIKHAMCKVSSIPFVTYFRMLGVTFDQTLSWEFSYLLGYPKMLQIIKYHYVSNPSHMRL